MGKSKDLATGNSAFYQDQTESDTRYVNVSGDTMTGDLSVTGDLFVTNSTNAKLSVSDNISEVGSGNLALQAQNSASSALKPMGFRAEDFRYAIGSNEVMKIDSSGRVTMPKQPVFMVILTSSLTVTGTTATTLPFNSEIFDVGGNYNTSNYRFTAPVNGLYYMHLHLELHSDSNWTNSTWTYIGDFFINGTQKTGADFWGHSGKYSLASNAVILELNANDYVEVKSRANNNTLRYTSDSAGAYFNCKWFGYLIG